MTTRPKPLNRPGKQTPDARQIRDRTRTTPSPRAARSAKWRHLFSGTPKPEEEDR